MDIEESALTMQKAMMLVGQASNAITYQRRLEVLKGFTDVKTAKGMLGKHAEKLATEPTELFGKDFKSVLKTTSTDSKQALEFFNPPSRQKYPFREGSSPAKTNHGKERTFFVRRDPRGCFNQNPRNRDGYPGKLNSQSQHVGNHSHSTGNPSFTEKPLCKNKQLFLTNWRKLTNDKNVLRNVKGWEIPIISKPTQQKVPHTIQFSKIEEQVVDSEVANM